MEVQEVKLRIPLKSFTLKRAIVLAAVGAACALLGLRLNCLTGSFSLAPFFSAAGLSQFFTLFFHQLISPELMLCLGFIACAYLSQIWPYFGAMPFWGLSLYSAYMILSNLGGYKVLAVIYVGVSIALSVFLFLTVSERLKERRYFIYGSWGLAIYIFLGAIINEGPYFTFTIIDGRYVFAAVLLGKALAAIFLIMATIVWVGLLSRDLNRQYFGGSRTQLKHLSLNWFRRLKYR
ncbi:MAG: hypothetical protein FWE69_00145 [Clostridiales bacterium]|nr:hypothetical protein [Clostridiales bacterium]